MVRRGCEQATGTTRYDPILSSRSAVGWMSYGSPKKGEVVRPGDMGRSIPPAASLPQDLLWNKSHFLSLSSTTLQGLSGSALVRGGNGDAIQITHLPFTTWSWRGAQRHVTGVEAFQLLSSRP